MLSALIANYAFSGAGGHSTGPVENLLSFVGLCALALAFAGYWGWRAARTLRQWQRRNK